MDVIKEELLYNFSEKEILEIKDNFPKINLISKGAFKGQIDIDHEYQNIHIKDTFDVGIIVPNSETKEIPKMIELGGRIDNIAKKYQINDKKELHYNEKSNFACLCVPQEERIRFPYGSSFIIFINDLVIPYLFGLSFYDKNGKWPWNEYSHGSLGILEYYGEHNPKLTIKDVEYISKYIRGDNMWIEYSKQIRKPNPEKYCICGSKKPINKCHDLAWKGIQHLNSEVIRLELNLKKMFNR